MSEELNTNESEQVDVSEERREAFKAGLLTPVTSEVEVAPSKHQIVKPTSVVKRDAGQKGVYFARKAKPVKRSKVKNTSLGKGAFKIWEDQPTEHNKVTTSTDVQSRRKKDK